MSVSQGHLQTIIFYEWRRHTGATAAITSSTTLWGEDTATISTVNAGSLGSKKETWTSKTNLGRDDAVEDFAVLGGVKEGPEATRILATRRRYPINSRQLPPTPRLPKSAGSMDSVDSMRFTRISICQFLLPRSPRKQFLEGGTGEQS